MTKTSNAVTRRKTCRLCDSDRLEIVMPMVPTPPGDHYVSAPEVNDIQETYSLDIVLCRDCGLAQLACTVSPDLLYGKYVYVSSVSLGLPEHFRGYARDVLGSIHPAEGSLVIDIGSNDGSLLRAFQEQKMRVLGVDPAREIARQATESGVETIGGYFTLELAARIRREHGAATIITANNVMANVDNLSAFIGGIRHLLAPDGVFIFETSYLLDVIEKSLVETVFHEHLSYFSAKPLDVFFDRFGMQLIEVQRVATKGGSLRGTVQLVGGSRTRSRNVGDLISLETDAGLFIPKTFQAYAERLDAVKRQLHELLRGLKSEGKTIAGYGASVGVTTLIYQFDLSESIDFIADDNSRKKDTFSPGHHIPVLPSEALYERNPDYVLILAWNYAEPIMRKHRAFQDKGGHFIVPLPDVRVLP